MDGQAEKNLWAFTAVAIVGLNAFCSVRESRPASGSGGRAQAVQSGARVARILFRRVRVCKEVFNP